MSAIGSSTQHPLISPVLSPKVDSTQPPAMKCFNTLRNHTRAVRSAVPFSNGRFASGSDDSNIFLWSHTGVRIDTFWNDFYNVKALAPITDTLLGCGLTGIPDGHDRGIVRVWDLKTRTSYDLGKYYSDCGILALALSPDKRLASGDEKGNFNIFNPFKNELYLGPISTNKRILSLAFVQDGKMLVTGHDNGEIHLWDSSTGTHLKPFNKHIDGVTALTVLSDGTLVSGSTDGNILLWDPSKDPDQACFKILKSGPVASLTTCGNTLVSGSWDKSFTVWNPLNAEFWQSPFNEHQEAIYTVAAFEDMIVTGSGDHTLKLWAPTNMRSRL